MKKIGPLDEQPLNEMAVEFAADSRNEAFARVVAAAFASQLDPTLEELSDVRTAVSEAVTNAIIHGYKDVSGKVRMVCRLYPGLMEIEISDQGIGIVDVEQAMQPLYTSTPELERSGMGFTVMESFMDGLEVESVPGQGTIVRMIKHIPGGS
ncbi:MAG TPA: anti-sigma F factor [Clostridiales bacterium]|nr:anti-sigma F factor [Clostridiales bacterium]